ncbi:MAG: hypothetical protein AB7G06_05495 [Bdellovibrionales bacterium]
MFKDLSALAASHPRARRSGKDYHGWQQNLPLRGEAVSPDLIKALTVRLQGRGIFYAGLSQQLKQLRGKQYEHLGWAEDSFLKDKPQVLRDILCAAREQVAAAFSGKLHMQDTVIFQRQFDAQQRDISTGRPHADGEPEDKAATGSFSYFTNIVDPQAVKAAGLKLEDFGVRVARIQGVDFDRVEKLRADLKKVRTFDEKMAIANAYEPGWDVLEPNVWWLISDNIPHYPGCLSPERIQQLGAGHEGLVTTINSEFSFHPERCDVH